MAEILAVIPARSGSKTVSHKNIKDLNGKPLLAYSIEHALQSKLISRIIVSTDDEEYAEIARIHGAEAPFIRPKELAEDLSEDIEVFHHALRWLKENELYIPEICVHLRPTHPIRKINDIDKMIEILMENPDIDSVRSVSKAQETPFKMWFFREDDSSEMVPVIKSHELYNKPRQCLRQAFIQNACVDVIRSSTILGKNSMTGNKIYGYIMNYHYDIDTEEDFLRASLHLKLKTGKRTFCFDIDGIIAEPVPDNNYSKAKPKVENIKVINLLYKMGHKIVLFTARGYVTKKNWQKVTEKQMEKWGVNYHQLIFGKPDADFYIDDRNLFFDELTNLT